MLLEFFPSKNTRKERNLRHVDFDVVGDGPKSLSEMNDSVSVPENINTIGYGNPVSPTVVCEGTEYVDVGISTILNFVGQVKLSCVELLDLIVD